MTILITGANGYIGQRLIPVLLEDEYRLICCVRNRSRFDEEESSPLIEAIEADFLKPAELPPPPKDIDVAYYLIHSMSNGKDFEEMESESARNFLTFVEQTNCRQIIYLTAL